MDVETEPRGMDAGEPRLILSSHRALSDGLGGFVNPSDIRALRVVSKTVRNSRVLVAITRVVTQRWTACAASKRARRRLEAVDAMGRFLIRPSADGDGAVITRVVDVEARLILGLVGRASRCATAWQGRRLCDDLVALRAACAHVVDDSAWHKDERRSHFNFGRDELKRSTQYFTQERLDRQQTDSSSEGGDKPELASRMPDPGPATLSMRMPGMAQCKDSKRFCDAFRRGRTRRLRPSQRRLPRMLTCRPLSKITRPARALCNWTALC